MMVLILSGLNFQPDSESEVKISKFHLCHLLWQCLSLFCIKRIKLAIATLATVKIDIIQSGFHTQNVLANLRQLYTQNIWAHTSYSEIIV